MTAGRIVSWIKAHGWAANLLFILIGSYFVAGAANSVVARSIRVMPSVENEAKSQRASSRRANTGSKVEYGAMAARNLFGALRENITPVEERPPEGDDLLMGTDYDPNDLRDCTLSTSLRATLVADGLPEWSLAVVYNNSKREAEVYSINDGSNQILDDATLVEVRDRQIVVRRRDHFELCLAEGEGGKPSKAKSPTTVRPSRNSGGSKVDASEHIRKTGGTEWEIDREYLDSEVLGNLSKVATQARIVPSFKNGKPNGFKLFSIKPKSLYSQIGLQNGDVIQKINGYEMNSPDKALEIYQKLKDAGSVSVELTRRGQNVSHSYAIR